MGHGLALDLFGEMAMASDRSDFMNFSRAGVA